jgi:transcriptional accessory protein Tex/SPT6
VDGVVTRVADFGVFVQIEGLVEGLMHVSETPLTRGEKPAEHYHEGDAIRAKILRIEDAEMKVGLSGQGVDQPAPGSTPAAPAVAAVAADAAEASAAAPDEPAAVPAAPAEQETAAPAAAEAEPAKKKRTSRKRAAEDTATPSTKS